MIEVNDPVDVSIVIPAKNEAKNIGECLDAIFGQDFAGTFEVIVIDSGSTDGTVELIQGYPQVRLHQIRPEEFRHGATRNLGAGMGRGRYLGFLNADATPAQRSWLSRFVEELRPEDVAGVYGRQIARDWAYPMEHFFLDYLYGATRRVQAMTNGVLDMDAILFSTVNCLIKRDVWERFPFSDEIVMTEDQVWSREVLAAGYKIVYSPDAAVYHSHNYTLRQAFKRFFDSGWSSEDSYLPKPKGATATLVGRSLDYSRREVGYLIGKGHWRWLPYAGLYEGAKLAGLMMGRWHRVLPEGLKTRFSANYKGAPRTTARGPAGQS